MLLSFAVNPLQRLINYFQFKVVYVQSLITEFVEEMVSGISGFITGIADGMVDLVEKLFWDPTLNTGAGGFTTVGLVIILGVAISVAYWVFGQVRRLIRG